MLRLPALLAVASLLVMSCSATYAGARDKREAGSIFKVRNAQGGGGTAWATEGPNGEQFLVSNAHVCGDDLEMAAENERDSQTWPGRQVLAKDNLNDVCLLSGIPGIEPLEIDESGELRPKDNIRILGHPALGPLTSALGFINWLSGGEIGSTARVYPGNSGSPAFNDDGEVAAMVSAYEMPSRFSVLVDARLVSVLIYEYLTALRATQE